MCAHYSYHILRYKINLKSFFPLFLDTAVHYFICMIRQGAHVIVTQMISTHDPMVRGSLDFPNLIKLSDIKQDFKFDLEIYTMVTPLTSTLNDLDLLLKISI